MASIILENHEDTKDERDARIERIAAFDSQATNNRMRFEERARLFGEPEKWCDHILSRYGLTYSSYVAFEVIFRQLMMHPKLKTGFVYQFDEANSQLSGKMNPPNRLAEIEKHLGNLPSAEYYALHPLSFAKADRIERVQLSLSKQFDDISRLIDIASSGITEKENIELIDLSLELETLKKKVAARALNKLKISGRKLNGFAKVNEKTGELKINVTRFEFFRHYCILYYELLLPYFKMNNIRDEAKNRGLYGFIAAKLNFEFGSRLGVKFTADMVSERTDSMEKLKEYVGAPIKLGLIDEDFYRLISQSSKKFELPHEFWDRKGSRLKAA